MFRWNYVKICKIKINLQLGTWEFNYGTAENVAMKLECIDEDGSNSVKMQHKVRRFNNMVVAQWGPDEWDNIVVEQEWQSQSCLVMLSHCLCQLVYDCIKILEEECVAIPWVNYEVMFYQWSTRSLTSCIGIYMQDTS